MTDESPPSSKLTICKKQTNSCVYEKKRYFWSDMSTNKNLECRHENNNYETYLIYYMIYVHRNAAKSASSLSNSIP